MNSRDLLGALYPGFPGLVEIDSLPPAMLAKVDAMRDRALMAAEGLTGRARSVAVETTCRKILQEERARVRVVAATMWLLGDDR